MAAAITDVQQDMNQMRALMEKKVEEKLGKPLNEFVETKTQQITPQAMKREGTENVDDYIRSVQQDALGGLLNQTISSTNFMPLILDPNVYDQGTLYMKTPLLTFLESKSRRTPAQSTKFNYIKMTSGFADEWIAETGSTVGSTDPNTDLGSATICVHALPISFSDLLGGGQSAISKAQLMNYAQEALREGFDNVLINGDSSGGSNQFDGLMKIAQASGATFAATDQIGLKDLRNLNAQVQQVKRGNPDFVLTNLDGHDQILQSMYATIRNENTTEIIGNNKVTAFNTGVADIPIVTDSFVPFTAQGSGTAIGKLGMFDSSRIFIQDYIHNSWVEKGKTKPVATDGWIVECSVMYNTEPNKTGVITGIPYAKYA